MRSKKPQVRAATRGPAAARVPTSSAQRSTVRGLWDIVSAAFWGMVVGSCLAPLLGLLYVELFAKTEEARVQVQASRYILSATCLGVAASLYWTSARRLSEPLRSIANALAGLFLLLCIGLAIWPPF